MMQPVVIDAQKIYVIASDIGMTKVGRSKNPEKRMKTLEDSGPLELSLAHSFSVPEGSAPAIEAAAHALLRKHHKRGEWFSVDPEVAMSAVVQAISDIGANKRTYVSFTFSMHEDTYDLIRKKATAEKCPMSHVIHECIAEEMRRSKLECIS